MHSHIDNFWISLKKSRELENRAMIQPENYWPEKNLQNLLRSAKSILSAKSI
jgi:hypothetical protein